ncbi:C40 family peptidase [Nocardiopsis coralli]|uniref:C40 family peptidase n=1 Tax=Nocardiopsis coralli TaxID=2772213 RepID=UPI002E2C0B8A|nr:NlpC/P60 family protein [Nocardiopsis coralli]
MASLGCGLALGAGVVVVPAVLVSVAVVSINSSGTTDAPDQVEGIDDTLLDAYRHGPQILEGEEYSQCTGMRWSILAGIGAVESDHGATVEISPDGSTNPPFVGPRLDGSGVGGNITPHYDTDDGEWDGDDEYDAAVGVTQHVPANWDRYGVDATGSGEADPHNVYDSVASTAVELCQSAQGEDVDFDDRVDLEAALFRYNPADWYVDDVMSEIDSYEALALAEGSEEGGSEAGQRAVEWALDQLGVPYVWGGNGPQDGGFDCSGLTQQAWSAAGVDIPRVTTDQLAEGDPVGMDELEPGDLLFYNRGPDPQPGHVTMYAGDGEMINAPATGKVVRLDPIDMEYYAEAFAGAVRPVH